MKKFYYVFMLLASLVAFQCTFVSCDKDDEDEYYAGESEDDYKPMVYTITSQWDLSGVSGLTSEQKKATETELSNSVKASETFNSRAEAVAAFDEMIVELKTNKEVSIPNMKAKFWLKRGTAIIKSAEITWK